MVYTLIDSTSETGGVALPLWILKILPLCFFCFLGWVFLMVKMLYIYFNLGWSDAFNFYKWFFVIYTSLQWIALVAWSLAVEKQAEARMKHQWHKFFAHGFMWDMFQNLSKRYDGKETHRIYRVPYSWDDPHALLVDVLWCPVLGRKLRNGWKSWKHGPPVWLECPVLSVCLKIGI